MSELKVYVKPIKTNMFGKMIVGQSYYLKSEADKVISEKDAEIAQLQAMLEERNKQIGELKEDLAVATGDCLALAGKFGG